MDFQERINQVNKGLVIQLNNEIARLGYSWDDNNDRIIKFEILDDYLSYIKSENQANRQELIVELQQYYFSDRLICCVFDTRTDRAIVFTLSTSHADETLNKLRSLHNRISSNVLMNSIVVDNEISR